MRAQVKCYIHVFNVLKFFLLTLRLQFFQICLHLHELHLFTETVWWAEGTASKYLTLAQAAVCTLLTITIWKVELFFQYAGWPGKVFCWYVLFNKLTLVQDKYYLFVLIYPELFTASNVITIRLILLLQCLKCKGKGKLSLCLII